MKHLINNIQLNIEDHGSAEPALIFLHYWGGTSRTWNGVVHQLKDHFRCIAYDMRGWELPTNQRMDMH
jgi:pimeloyl-ACP methyl ester carboxylesterase